MPMRSAPFGAKVPMEPVLLEVEYCHMLDDVCTPGADEHVARKATARTSDAAWDAVCKVTQKLWFSDAGDERSAKAAHQSALQEDDIALDVSFDGGVLQVKAKASNPVILQAIRVTFRHAFSSDEFVLVNGYQSWTETTERPAWSGGRLLPNVPARLAKRFASDSRADDAKENFAPKRGVRHGFTYATFRRGNGMVLVGSLDESRGFTEIWTDAGKGEVHVEPECPARPLEAHEATTLLRCAVVRGTMKRCYDRWFELMGIDARPAKPLVGYTSWYKYFDRIDHESLERDLENAREFFESSVSLDLHGVNKVFLVEDGFCRVGDWLHVNEEKFSGGMRSLARRIADAGFIPGLWVAPFICAKDSRVFEERPEWLVRDDAGDPVQVSDYWGGAYALNTRDVDVRSYILQVLQTFTREWGFRLVKVDFLYGACMRAHDGMNCGQLMADAVDLLRTGVGHDVLLLGSGVPLASGFGKLDYCRIGPDVSAEDSLTLPVRLPVRERASAKSALANTYARAPLDGRAFGNDPDAVFLGSAAKLSDAQKDELLFANADLGRVLLISETMASWNANACSRYMRALETLIERNV